MSAVFIGKLEAYHSGLAFVTLWNRETDERLEAGCNPELLQEKGISEGNEFMCRVNRSRVVFRRLKPKRITPEQVAEITAASADLVEFLI